MSATTECKKWWMPEDFWLPLCSNKFEPEEGNQSCPICVSPIGLVGPTGCCGCSATEQFPAVWNFAKPFSITGSYAVADVVTSTLTSNSTCTVSGGGDATITSNKNRLPITDYVDKPLIRAANSGLIPTCGWGNGKGVFDGWYHSPTYQQSCPLTAGTTEVRCSYTGEGPFVYPNGNTVVSNAFGACFWPVSTAFNWSNVTDTPYEGSDFTSYAWFYKPGCWTGASSGIQRQLYVKSSCYHWRLRCENIEGVQMLYLTFRCVGYSYTWSDKLIYWSNPPFGTLATWGHDELQIPSCVSDTSGGVAESVCTWGAAYPCGQPESIVLTKITGALGGMLTGCTVPETIKLLAVY